MFFLKFEAPAPQRVNIIIAFINILIDILFHS